jgi:hypothetical protein
MLILRSNRGEASRLFRLAALDRWRVQAFGTGCQGWSIEMTPSSLRVYATPRRPATGTPPTALAEDQPGSEIGERLDLLLAVLTGLGVLGELSGATPAAPREIMVAPCRSARPSESAMTTARSALVAAHRASRRLRADASGPTGSSHVPVAPARVDAGGGEAVAEPVPGDDRPMLVARTCSVDSSRMSCTIRRACRCAPRLRALAGRARRSADPHIAARRWTRPSTRQRRRPRPAGGHPARAGRP